MDEKTGLKDWINDAEKILIGIGPEWAASEASREAYQALFELIGDKDYFIVTSLTDGAIYDTPLNRGRIVAPCGNERLIQCSKACTRKLWDEGEIVGDVCPYCGAPLVKNTVDAENYIEESYLFAWKTYTAWQSLTLNKKLLVLELGEGFAYPTVMRWPFEKIVFFNNKAHLFRVNEKFYQLPSELEGKAVSVKENSCQWIIKNAADN